MSNNLMAKRVKIATDVLYIKAKTCKFILDKFDRIQTLEMKVKTLDQWIQTLETQIKTSDQWIQISGSDISSKSLEPCEAMVALREKLKAAIKDEIRWIFCDSSLLCWILIEFNIRDVTEKKRKLNDDDMLDSLRHEDVRNMLREIIEMEKKEEENRKE